MVTAAVLRGLWIAALVVAVSGPAAVSGAAAGSATAAAAPASRPSAPAADAGSGAVVPPFHSVRDYTEVALPTRLRIPSAGIDTGLEQLGLAADGTIAAPSGWQIAGWYSGGPRPGQQGPAVIVGHVDSTTGPAVFFRLPQLQAGAPVYVDRADGSSVRFRVSGRRQVPKEHFPADAVYSPTLETSLILITCGGSFDTRTGHYRDNLVVTAVPG